MMRKKRIGRPPHLFLLCLAVKKGKRGVPRHPFHASIVQGMLFLLLKRCLYCYSLATFVVTHTNINIPKYSVEEGRSEWAVSPKSYFNSICYLSLFSPLRCNDHSITKYSTSSHHAGCQNRSMSSRCPRLLYRHPGYFKKDSHGLESNLLISIRLRMIDTWDHPGNIADHKDRDII